MSLHSIRPCSVKILTKNITNRLRFARNKQRFEIHLRKENPDDSSTRVKSCV